MREIVANKSYFSGKVDTSLVVSIILLWGLGLVTLYTSASTYAQTMFNDSLYFVKRQLSFSAVGAVFFVFLSVCDLEFIRKHLLMIVTGTLFLCLLTFFPGIGRQLNGARRWISIAGMTFQPSETVKFTMVLFLSNFFAKKHDKFDDPMVSVIPPACILLLFVFVVFAQNDFSTAFFVLVIGFLMFFIAGVKLKWFFTFICFVFPFAFIFIFTEPYRVNRIIAYLNPGADPYGGNYQLMMAQRAITSGGFWGKGIGGAIRRDSIIPEVQADFIFAGWVEEMGLFGVILYFIILLYFVWKGYKVALNCEDRFRALVAFGASSCIFFQSLMNCGVVSGIFPSTGIPLPFFSSGGSSMLVSMCLCGLIVNVSRWNEGENSYE